MAKRILVVDDDECVRFVIWRSLAGQDGGCDVVTAASGREALDRLSEGEFDLIITDLRMPEMDGIQLTEAVRALYTRPAIVWMTAYGCADAVAAAQRLGVGRCLEKPLEIEQIRASVAAALEQVAAAG